jgi:hypothetical protein
MQPRLFTSIPTLISSGNLCNPNVAVKIAQNVTVSIPSPCIRPVGFGTPWEMIIGHGEYPDRQKDAHFSMVVTRVSVSEP